MAKVCLGIAILAALLLAPLVLEIRDQRREKANRPHNPEQQTQEEEPTRERYRHPTEEEHRSQEQAFWRWQVHTEQGKDWVSRSTLYLSIIALVFAGLAFWQTWRQADDAHETLTSVQRAYVEPVGVRFDPVKEVSGKIAYWLAYITIQNTGVTPTRFLRAMGTGMLFERIIIADPETQLFDPPLGPGLGWRLGPQEKLTFGPISVFPRYLNQVDPLDMTTRPKPFETLGSPEADMLFWGWAEYKDVFPNTPTHITMFCYRLVAIDQSIGDHPRPDGFPDLAKSPDVVPCNYHSCTDDECTRQNLRPLEAPTPSPRRVQSG